MHTPGQGRNQAVIWEKRCTLNCFGTCSTFAKETKEGAGARASLGAFSLCETDENRKKAGAGEAQTGRS